MTRPLIKPPKDWQVATLEANKTSKVIIEVGSGSTPSTDIKEYWDGHYPWLTPKEMTSPQCNRYIRLTERSVTEEGLKQAGNSWPRGTVMLTKRAPVGAVAFNDVPMAINQGILAFRCGEKLLPEFLFYWLKANGRYLDAVANGSTYPELYPGDLFEFEIGLPSIEEQHVIVNILQTLDEKIELNRHMNATLEKIVQATFKSWFVDFDPVRAKLDGRQPYGLNAEVAALFPSSFEIINGEEIPNGWKITPVSNIIEIIGGGTPKTTIEEYWNGSIPWFSVTDTPLQSDVFVIDTEKHVSQSGVDSSSTNILPINTTIITARGTVGNIALVGVPMAMNQSCYGIRGKSGYSEYFIHFLLRRAIADFQQQTHGTVFDTITRETFDDVNIIAPPELLAQKFDEINSLNLKMIRSNLSESRTLERIRNKILPKLVSGVMRIPHVEKTTEATA